MYDFLVVGSGLAGATFAHLARKAGQKCLILEKQDHIAGNCYTELVEDIHVHRYGAHIFHTGNHEVWEFVNRFASFNNYINSPIANYRGELLNLPFNMNTFRQMWDVTRPEEAEAIIEKQRRERFCENPQNLEEQAINLVGTELYEKLIRGYTEKQWGRPCTQLPPFIIKRLPVRFTYDNNYFNDPYQGIPQEGYTALVEAMLEGIEVLLETDYLAEKEKWDSFAPKVVYTGPIDSYFGYCYGSLGYRSLRFETETLEQADYQGNAVVNYTDREIPYTRIIEHKHFTFGNQPKTVISREYSTEWKPGDPPYYPVNDERNNALYERYRLLAEKEDRVLFCGRLGEYRYLDMDKVIERTMALAKTIL